MDALPSGKALPALAALTVGMTSSTQDVGGNKGEQLSSLSIHGADPNDNRFLFDGMRYQSPNPGGTARQFYINQNDVQETVVETSGMAAELDTGGVVVNIVPKTGSNVFSGNLSFNGANDKFQSNNLTDALRARGLTGASSVKKIYDAGGGFGGPFVRDRLWFYTAHRWVGRPGIRAWQLL